MNDNPALPERTNSAVNWAALTTTFTVLAFLGGLIFYCSGVWRPCHYQSEATYGGVSFYSEPYDASTDNPRYKSASAYFEPGAAYPNLFVRFRDSNEVYSLAELSEDIVAQVARRKGLDHFHSYELAGGSEISFRDGRVNYLHLYRSDHLEMSSKREGPFLSLPMNHVDLVKLLGQPVGATETCYRQLGDSWVPDMSATGRPKHEKISERFIPAP